MVDEAIGLSEFKVEHVVVYQRDFVEAELVSPRDKDWGTLYEDAPKAGLHRTRTHGILYTLYIRPEPPASPRVW